MQPATVWTLLGALFAARGGEPRTAPTPVASPVATSASVGHALLTSYTGLLLGIARQGTLDGLGPALDTDLPPSLAALARRSSRRS